MAIGWGIIGPGRIARRFAEQLPESTTGRLVAVASRDAARARAFGSEFGATRWYGDYGELLADPEVAAVYVATPHPWHAEWVIRAAEAGKHILCEKPLALNAATAMAAIEAAREHDVFLMEAYMYRCHPQTAQLVSLIRDGAIGEVRHIHAQFSFASTPNPEGRLYAPALGGGGILDIGGYPVSAARLIAGAVLGVPHAEPEDVLGAGHVGTTGVDEWAVATLRFAGGVEAHVACGVGVSAERTLRVYGTGGYLEVPDPWTNGAADAGRILVYRVGAEPAEVTTPPTAPYAAEADTVAAHLADRQAPAMSWADTLGNLSTMDRWRAAIGVRYPVEETVPTVHGRPLRRRAGHHMRYGRIPGVDKDISRLVMGVDNQPSLAHAAVTFDDFVERGGNAFDTAWLYGHGQLERQLGGWINRRGIRDQVVIIGKGAHTPHCDPESLVRQIGESLDRLGTDHVDLYLMHRDNLDVPVGEFVDAMAGEHAAGRVSAYGVSNWSLSRVDEANEYAAKAGLPPLAVLSNQFSLAETYDVPWQGCRHATDRASRDWLEAHNMPLVPWSSQARGFFTGRAHPDNRTDEELVRCWYSEANFARLARATELADRLGVPATAVALAYVLHQPFPTFPIIGPRTIAETASSLNALTIDLTPDTVRWLDTGEA